MKRTSPFISALLLLTSAILLTTAHLEATFAASNAYTTTWQATHLIGVDFGPSWQDHGIAIGVAGWTVTGVYPTSAFKETWSTDGGSSMRATYSQGTDGKMKLTASTRFNEAKWLVGVAGSGQFRFFVAPPTSFEDSAWNHPYFAYGKGVTCVGSDRDCFYTSGAYGFTFAESMNQARGSSQVDKGGTFQPLSWDITGVICEDVNDRACK